MLRICVSINKKDFTLWIKCLKIDCYRALHIGTNVNIKTMFRSAMSCHMSNGYRGNFPLGWKHVISPISDYIVGLNYVQGQFYLTPELSCSTSYMMYVFGTYSETYANIMNETILSNVLILSPAISCSNILRM